MSHDASPTWSGFNYQGKVALYHTLKIINDNLDENVYFDFTDYNLLVENHEDFDIQGPDGFISFHQVKAINDPGFNTYKNALLAMTLKINSDEYAGVEAYLHTWKKIDIEIGSSFILKIRESIFEVIDDYNNNAHKPSTKIGKAAIYGIKDRPKLSKIIRSYFTGGKEDLAENEILDTFNLHS